MWWGNQAEVLKINPQQPLRLNEGCRADWAALDPLAVSRYCLSRLRLASRATALRRGHDRYLEVPLRPNRSKGVMQDNADKYDHADVLIMQKSPEAASRLTVAGKPLVPGHQHRGEGN